MIQLRIKVVPGASRDELAGWLGDELKVRVSAPPEGGKANKALVHLLAGALQIPPRDITVTAGTSSPRKIITITGLGEEEVRSKLSRHGTA